MNRTSFLIVSVVVAALAGCNERSTIQRDGYDQRQPLEGTLFPSDQTMVGDAAIARILDGKIVIPDQAMIAVLPMGCGDDGNPGYSGATQAAIAERVQREPRVLGVARIPTLVLPEHEHGIPRIREACARLQCDLVLLYLVRQDVKVHRKFFFFLKDEARSFASVEAVLMDVRTGMIPWTDVVDSEITALQDDDHGAWEKARTASVQAATKSLAEDLAQFFARTAKRASAPAAEQRADGG